MPRVLIVDDDLGTRETFGLILRQAGFGTEAVGTGSEALAKLRQTSVDLLFLDLRLPDMSGLDVLRSIGGYSTCAKAVMMSAFGSIPASVEAMRLGAVDFVEKPLSDDELIRLAEQTLRAAGLRRSERETVPTTPAARRWVQIMTSAVGLAEDPRTLEELAQASGLSVPTLKNRCRAVGLGARSSLAFARILRAVYLANSFGSRTSTFLDSDPRTCKHLFELARLPESAASTQPCVATLLREQRLIAEPSVLATLRSALRAPAVFCISLCACCCMRNLIEGVM